ncbi:putative inositol monophosphatase 3 [Orussus abietinus]|uniref:putative inositol monophosphatase 3 n=1 Tax=Orussus abietinus TaxID=222816 RepID=UPI000626D2DF|nr:putative inositol monophosphatase 3 [Orussus abietinus]
MYLGANVRINKIGIVVIIACLVILYLYASRRESALNVDNRNVISMKALLAGAIRAAEFGGLEVITVHDQAHITIKSKGKTKEGVNDPVTTADYRSHCTMYRSLIEAFPKIIVISEEKSVGCDHVPMPDSKFSIKDLEMDHLGKDVAVSASDVTVWIDPLDATKEFTEDLLQYVTTMVCVTVKGEPVIGVIHKPFDSKRTYWSWIDHGSSENLNNLPGPQKNKTPLLTVSRSHAGQVHTIAKAAFGEDVQVISAAGAGYKALELVVGNATAYIHTTAIKKWDICAGTAIIRALGGTVTPLFGPPDISFGPTDSTSLSLGLLATMKDHNWYHGKLSSHV